jgi:hypothetical protein
MGGRPSRYHSAPQRQHVVVAASVFDEVVHPVRKPSALQVQILSPLLRKPALGDVSGGRFHAGWEHFQEHPQTLTIRWEQFGRCAAVALAQPFAPLRHTPYGDPGRAAACDGTPRINPSPLYLQRLFNPGVAHQHS